jgi:hypothetical protein
MLEIHQVLGICAGLLQLTALPIYLRDIFRGGTKPSRVTWWILCFLNIMIAASYFASGARATIWIPVAYAVGFFVIAVLSIKYGEGKWTSFDRICVAGAIVAACIWWFANIPQLALYLLVLIDFFGLLPTIIKTYQKPDTENRTSWVIATIASAINVVAIEAWTVAIALYPLYVVITNGIVLYCILFARRDIQRTEA